MPAHPTFYCKRNIYDKYGFYNESFRIAGDFELMLRYLEKYKIRSNYISKTLISMKSGGISNKSLLNKFKILSEEFKAFELNNISLNKALYLFEKSKKGK